MSGIRSEWLIACERAVLEQGTGNLTLYNVVEDIGVAVTPAMHGSIGLAARYVRLDGASVPTMHLTFRFVRVFPDGSENVIVTIPGEWSAESPTMRVLQNFGRLRIPRIEPIQFRVDHSIDEGVWVPGATVRINVNPMNLTQEQIDAIRRQHEELGLPIPNGLRASQHT